jgi:uncharacterized protein DUF1501
MGKIHFGSGTSRRSFLKVGALAGLSLSELFRLEAFAATPGANARARSVINIFLPGGMAHQDTFDPKPFSPVEYRGSTEAIDTAIPGIRFGHHLKRTAKIADRISVIRSFSHGEAAHERGVHNMFTGYRPSPAVAYPSMGSVVAHEQGPRANLPAYVCVPDVPTPYAGTGFLSASYAPFSVGSDPASKSFVVRDLNLPGGVDEARATRRRRLLDAVNAHFRAREKADNLDAMDSFYQRAYDLVGSPDARAAFDLNAEPDAIRDEYGRNAAGQRMLLARRLVEAGVRFVTLSYGSWDMHARIHDGMAGQLPAFDQAYAMLIADLDRRGMLDDTLVLVTTEFGRTPKLNPDGGRDHWPRVFSVTMAGGGVKRGYVHGQSDTTATAVDDAAVGPEDLGRTVFTLLGVDPDKALLAPGNRPVRIIRGGRVLSELLA